MNHYKAENMAQINGFDHVLVGKDGSVVIIDSKQIKTNGAISGEF